VDLEIASFVKVRQVGFAFEKSDLSNVPLTTGGASPVTETLASASLLTVGLSGGSAFVGLNADTSQAIGFSVTVDSLALAVIKPASTTDARSWAALSGVVSGASFVAPPSLPFHVSATGLTLEINTKDAVGSKFVDYSALPGGKLTVATGPPRPGTSPSTGRSCGPPGRWT